MKIGLDLVEENNFMQRINRIVQSMFLKLLIIVLSAVNYVLPIGIKITLEESC